MCYFTKLHTMTMLCYQACILMQRTTPACFADLLPSIYPAPSCSGILAVSCCKLRSRTSLAPLNNPQASHVSTLLQDDELPRC